MKKGLILLTFIVVMLVLYMWVIRTTPAPAQSQLQHYFQTFKDNIERAHWQWKAGNQAQQILFIVYDSQGLEKNRSPIEMNGRGWPMATSNDDCEKLWYKIVGDRPQYASMRLRWQYEGSDSKATGKCFYQVAMGGGFLYDSSNGDIVWD